MTPLYGLVLCGGSSTRMGKDKSLLNYHGKPQKEYLKDLLSLELPEVYISTRVSNSPNENHVIEDQFEINSPLNGIMSAFIYNPKVAWLVIACDMPLIDQKHIKLLVEGRNTDYMATCFLGTDNKPHPLFAIYEPAAFTDLKEHSKENVSPRDFLMKSQAKTISPSNKDFLKNINTLEAYEQFVHNQN